MASFEIPKEPTASENLSSEVWLSYFVTNSVTRPPSDQYGSRSLSKAERRRPDRRVWPDAEYRIRDPDPEPAGSRTLSYLTEWELSDPEPVI